MKSVEVKNEDKDENFILLSEIEIDLEQTLFVGQVFHFVKTEDSEYCGTLNSQLIVLKQVEDSHRVAFLFSPYKYHIGIKIELLFEILHNFFNLNILIQKQQSILTIHNSQISDKLIINYKNSHLPLSVINLKSRFITNDIYSSIFSFICSQNNNIKRITSMVQFIYSLGDHYCYKGIRVHKFPELFKLTNESIFSQNKFGYRARYISSTAKRLIEKDYFNKPYSLSEIYEDLLNCKGIGLKVRDCIALTSLKAFDVIPVDTHIFKWTKNTFNYKTEKLSKKNYHEIQEIWKQKFGNYAGIIQFYIFSNIINKQV